MPELPTSLVQPAKEPVIYTIPEQFYGVAAKAQLPKVAVAPAPAPAAPPTVPGGPSPAPVSVKPAGQSRKWLLIPIFALLLLAALGFGAWWFLQPKTPPVTTPEPSLTLPPEPEPQPEPQPQPQPEPEPATTTTETPPVPAPQADADTDGLTNAEETLFGTNAAVADSDSDGFNDSVEVTNLYNPTAVAPKKLVEAGLVKPYDGAGFELLFPSSWTPAEGSGHLVSFVADGNETISLDVRENPDRQSSLDWFMSRNPGASPSSLQAFTTKSGLDGVRDPAGGSSYVAVGDKTYVFTDAVVDATKRSFASTFQMMVNSFSKKP